MIVPDFWAEARRQHKSPGKQITVRRFGWSNVSEADALAIAEERAETALGRILSGENLQKREPKVPYNGAAGIPIREEVLERHGEQVITRNSYGAHCLNSPDALFADIDLRPGRQTSRRAGTSNRGVPDQSTRRSRQSSTSMTVSRGHSSPTRSSPESRF